mgnify:CR=1 FL=1
MKKILFFLAMGVAAMAMVSCENQDTDFPDFDYTTAYFPYQTPIRTLVLGNDEVVDNTTDNEGKVRIIARAGGTRNGINATYDFVVDPSLCDNLTFEDGTPVVPMPENYYTLAAQQIPISGVKGYVEVQLTDEFFADPKAITNTYVIPLRLTDAVGVDSILVGDPLVENPWRLQASDWGVAPKDYVLYLVKFISPWSGNFLRRGVDIINENGTTSTNVRHEQYIENDEVFNLATTALNTVSYKFDDHCNLLLTFNEETKECTFTTDNDAYTVSGTGKYVSDVADEVWGEKVRDVIYLDYTVTTSGKTVATKDTLVARDRGVSGAPEEFSYTYNAQ